MRPPRALLAIALLLSAGWLRAGENTGASFLKIGVGARACGMSSAFTAVADDPSAMHWNPAGLAMVKSVDIRIQGTAQGTARLGIASALHDLQDFNPNDTSAGNLAKAQGIANQINQNLFQSILVTADEHLIDLT